MAPRLSRERLSGATTLFGRDAERALLDQAWARRSIGLVTIIAMGGAGKTALLSADYLSAGGSPTPSSPAADSEERLAFTARIEAASPSWSRLPR